MRYLIVLLCLGAVVPVWAQGSKDEAAIRQLYASYQKAYQTRDVKPVIAMTTPGYTATMKDGTKLTRAAYHDAMIQQLNSARKETFKIEKLHVEGNRATVVTEETLEVPALGSHSMNSISRGQDSWERTAAGWRLAHTESLSETYTMDGQPFDPAQFKP